MSPHDEHASKEQQVEGCEIADEMRGSPARPNLGVMVIMGTITIADLTYTVGHRPSDDKFYVTAHDASEDTSVEVPVDGEDAAVKLFAALIACDEPDLTLRLEAYRDKFAGYIA